MQCRICIYERKKTYGTQVERTLYDSKPANKAPIWKFLLLLLCAVRMECTECATLTATVMCVCVLFEQKAHSKIYAVAFNWSTSQNHINNQPFIAEIIIISNWISGSMCVRSFICLRHRTNATILHFTLQIRIDETAQQFFFDRQTAFDSITLLFSSLESISKQQQIVDPALRQIYSFILFVHFKVSLCWS